MLCNRRPFPTKQILHLCLGQPYCFFPQIHSQAGPSTLELVQNYIAKIGVHAYCFSNFPVFESM